MIPKHVKYIRNGHRISEVVHLNDGSIQLNIVKEFTQKVGDATLPAINAAKRYVRIDLGCKGGPKSEVRTAESLAEQLA